MITIGCCGWAESQEKYYRDFGVIEVQETFYQPGRLEKYERWKAEAPAGFEFVVKAWQLITHEPSSPTYRRLRTPPVAAARKNRHGSFRPTEEVLAAWEVTQMIARTLGSSMILFQSPASFRPTLENRKSLRTFFRTIDRGAATLIWEPRDDWDSGDVKHLCSTLDLVHCVDPFKARPLHGRIRYYRLHGRPGYDLRYRYTMQDLRELLRTVDRKRVYILFNNLSMLRDARRLRRLVAHP
jgi:uncharacterized protein YecE (DUF72 family)